MQINPLDPRLSSDSIHPSANITPEMDKITEAYKDSQVHRLIDKGHLNKSYWSDNIVINFFKLIFAIGTLSVTYHLEQAWDKRQFDAAFSKLAAAGKTQGVSSETLIAYAEFKKALSVYRAATDSRDASVYDFFGRIVRGYRRDERIQELGEELQLAIMRFEAESGLTAYPVEGSRIPKFVNDEQANELEKKGKENYNQYWNWR